MIADYHEKSTVDFPPGIPHEKATVEQDRLVMLARLPLIT